MRVEGAALPCPKSDERRTKGTSTLLSACAVRVLRRVMARRQYARVCCYCAALALALALASGGAAAEAEAHDDVAPAHVLDEGWEEPECVPRNAARAASARGGHLGRALSAQPAAQLGVGGFRQGGREPVG